MKDVLVGVVGAGHLGRFHALNYAQMPGAELVGVTDIDQEKAQRVAEETGSRAFASLDELLKNVEAVTLSVPTDQHFELGMRILDSGVHILVEKPVARDLIEADGLIDRSRGKGVVLQVGHVERFNPAFRALEGLELCPRFIESHRLAPFNPRGTEVSVILDLMIHDIDIALSLVKCPVDQIDASGVAVVSDTTDIANARLRFSNGSVANLTASRISHKKMRKMRLFQKETYVTIDFLDRRTEIYQLAEIDSDAGQVLGEIGVGDRKRSIICRRPEIPEEMGLYKELEAFIDTIRGGHPPAVSAEEGRDALAVAMRILENLNP